MKNDPSYRTFSLLLERRKRLAQRLEKMLAAARTELRSAREALDARRAELLEQEQKVNAHDRRLDQLLEAPAGFSSIQLMSLRDFREVLVARVEASKADALAAESTVGEREQALAEAQRNIARNNAQLDALEARLKDLGVAHDLAIEDMQDEEAEEAHGARARAQAGRQAAPSE
jgi:type III secretion system HrpB7-like protein